MYFGNSNKASDINCLTRQDDTMFIRNTMLVVIIYDNRGCHYIVMQMSLAKVRKKDEGTWMAVTPQVASDYGWQISVHIPRIAFEDKCVTATVSVSRDSSWIGLLAPRKVQPQLPAVSSSSSSTNWAAVRCGQLSGEECVAQTLFAASLEWKWAEIHHAFKNGFLGILWATMILWYSVHFSKNMSFSSSF